MIKTRENILKLNFFERKKHSQNICNTFLQHFMFFATCLLWKKLQTLTTNVRNKMKLKNEISNNSNSNNSNSNNSNSNNSNVIIRFLELFFTIFGWTQIAGRSALRAKNQQFLASLPWRYITVHTCWKKMLNDERKNVLIIRNNNHRNNNCSNNNTKKINN